MLLVANQQSIWDPSQYFGMALDLHSNSSNIPFIRIYVLFVSSEAEIEWIEWKMKMKNEEKNWIELNETILRWRLK